MGINQRTIIDEIWHNQVKTLNLKNDYIHIVNAKGQTILVSENFKSDVETEFKRMLSLNFKETIFKDLKFDNKSYRAISMPVNYNNQPYIIIQVATSLTPALHLLNGLKAAFLLDRVSFLSH